MKCIDPKAKNGDFVDFDLGGGAQDSPRRNTKEDKHKLSFFDLLRKAMKRAEGMGQMRASTVQQKREEVFAALQYAAGFQ